VKVVGVFVRFRAPLYKDNNTDYFNPENGQSVKLNSTVLPTDKLLWSLD
jgi:hypothetical protein